jgi:hypothetical protein
MANAFLNNQPSDALASDAFVYDAPGSSFYSRNPDTQAKCDDLLCQT